ncbi:MAG: SCO family protein [Methylocapsa sp.]|nr:SCO family protein [Methylocapsa sp.]
MKERQQNASQTRAARQLFYAVAVFFAGLAGITGLLYAFMPARSTISLQPLGTSYTMVASDGRTLTSADLSGRPYLVFFGYTHCPDFCPATLLDISAVFKKLGPERKMAAVFVTTDPERDTPEVLRAYLLNFDSRIVGLTGDPLKIEAISKAFRVYARKVPGETPGEYSVDHSGAVYLMDKRGKFVSVFDLQRPADQAARELEAYF